MTQHMASSYMNKFLERKLRVIQNYCNFANILSTNKLSILLSLFACLQLHNYCTDTTEMRNVVNEHHKGYNKELMCLWV